MFERRLYHHLDWLLLGAVLTLCMISVAMIYSTTVSSTASKLPWTQTYAIVLGLGLFAICLTVDYRVLTDKSHFIYLGLLALLLYVLLFGTVAGGARRWISLKVFNLQPSEFAKVGVALVSPSFSARTGAARRPPATSSIGGGLTVVPLRAGGAGAGPRHGRRLWRLSFSASRIRRDAHAHSRHPRASGGSSRRRSAWTFASRIIRRAESRHFSIPPGCESAGYQQIQARITVGSGGLRGKGFTKGTQGQLRFLPVAHNDFIFPCWRKSRDFVGVLFVLWPVHDRDLAIPGGRAPRQGQAGGVSRHGPHGQLHVSGDLQRHDVGRPGAGQGFDASVDELWRLVDDGHACELRPHPQRADAPFH
jgi:rod shape determining protein RodA